MTKSRGILIFIVAAAIAGGLFWWLQARGNDPAAVKPMQSRGSAQLPAQVRANTPVPARAKVTVTSAKGPIVGATVRLAHEDGEITLAQTDNEGSAHATGLVPGKWTISASADGFEPGALATRELAAAENLAIEIKLEAGGRTLSGLVTDASGGPIAGARIDAAKLGASIRPSSAVASTSTAADGRYKLSVAEGQVLVAASEPSYAAQSRNVEIGPGGATADFQLVPGGVIEGIVLHQRTRDPVPGAIVQAQRDTPAMMLGERGTQIATAGADGKFRFTGLRPGAYNLDAHAPSLASHESTIVGIGVAEQVSDVEVLVASSPAIRGVVVDETGAPAPNATVLAFAETRGDSESVDADAKGAFTVEGLSPGRYALMARGDELIADGMKSVELETKDIDGVKVTVRRGVKLAGHVERRQICEVQVEPDEAAMRRDAMPMMMTAPITTGPDGVFQLGSLSDGSYRISARCPSGEHGEKAVQIAAGMGEVIVEVKPGASIAGRVLDGTGKPVASVSVMATPRTGAERTMIVNGVVTSGVQGLTNAKGEYELRGLAAGAYRLRVLDRGRPLPMKAETKVTLAATERKTGVVLTVERADGVIRGVVTGPDGKPLADAWVSIHQDIGDLMSGVMDHEEGESKMVMVQSTDDGVDSSGTPPALTDANGKFEVAGLARHPLTVIAEAQAGKLRGRALKVVPDATITIQVLDVTALRGTVKVAGAMPASFTVEIDGPTHAQRSFASPDGSFSFARVDPGDYTVIVTSSAGNGRATVKVTAGQPATVEVVLAANAIVIGKLIDPAGKPLGGLPVVIIPDAGDGQLRMELHGAPPTSNQDGTFRLEAKAGKSALLVLVPPRPVSKKGLVLEAGKTLDIGAFTVAAEPPPKP